MSQTTVPPETEDYVKDALDAERWAHTQGVVDLSDHLADTYDLPVDELRTAALFHDNARNLPEQHQYDLAETFHDGLDPIEQELPALWHAPAGAQRMIDAFGFERSEPSVQAVAYHTTATPELIPCLRGLLVADFAEPGRSFDRAESVRSRIGQASLEQLVRTVVREKLVRTIQSDSKVHPRSLDTHNRLCD